MDVVIANGRSAIDDEVRALVEEKVGRLGLRWSWLERAVVRFAEEHNPRIADCERCEVEMVGHGMVVRARAAAPGALAAVDLVVEKLEHRLERTKGQLVGRSHPRRRPARGAAARGLRGAAAT